MLYRIYTLTDHDEGKLVAQGEFDDDAAAVEFARGSLSEGYAAEVWRGHSLVARLGGSFDLDLAAVGKLRADRPRGRGPARCSPAGNLRD
jgi:hypothetical protein